MWEFWCVGRRDLLLAGSLGLVVQDPDSRSGFAS